MEYCIVNIRLKSEVAFSKCTLIELFAVCTGIDLKLNRSSLTASKKKLILSNTFKS